MGIIALEDFLTQALAGTTFDYLVNRDQRAMLHDGRVVRLDEHMTDAGQDAVMITDQTACWIICVQFGGLTLISSDEDTVLATHMSPTDLVDKLTYR